MVPSHFVLAPEDRTPRPQPRVSAPHERSPIPEWALGPGAEAPDDAEVASLQAILRELHRRTGVDLSLHRPATIRRRIWNRMLSVQATSVAGYLEFLRATEGEATRLLERATIKVSRFYRNRVVFEQLRAIWLPTLAARVRRPLSLWCAGCARGEEAYTWAMLLEEAGIRGTVHATDVDASALAAAAEGIYPREACGELPESLAARYLEPRCGGSRDAVRVGDALRARVRFAHHDLAAAPFRAADEQECFDVISCRNVLIYFGRETQERVFGSLRDQLSTEGLLLLGEAEWPPVAVVASLETLSGTARLFRARATGGEE